MQGKMKNVIAALFILIAQLGFSQKDTSTVGKNKNKIDQLNERLDRLLKGGSSEEVDSTNYKLDYIFQEIKNIKSEISEMKQSIEEIKTIDRSVLNAENAVVAIKDAQGVSAGAYYVVLASNRSKERAEKALKRLSGSHKVRLVKNSKETWFHIILESELTEKQAGLTTAEYRKKEFSDAWWTTGKKLIQ
jgi:prefoldin subunit 5